MKKYFNLCKYKITNYKVVYLDNIIYRILLIEVSKVKAIKNKLSSDLI